MLSLLRAPLRALRLPGRTVLQMTTVTGTALRWNEQRGFGFISPEDGSDDVFVHASAITDGEMLKPGAAVSYTLSVDERSGRECATDVTGGSGRPVEGGVDGPPPEGMAQGTVKRWTDKGFGFITPDDGSEDAFCHRSCLRHRDARASFALLQDAAKLHSLAAALMALWRSAERVVG